MTPLEKYQQDLLLPEFRADAAQLAAMQSLNELYLRLTADDQRPASLLSRLRLKTKVLPQKGLYMWGGVGRGKTYLMDTFFDALPFDRKMRMHFHRFMHLVQVRLTELKGQKNPLEAVAKEFGRQARVLCFDEFFVSDIGDAMILATLMQHLFEQGVSLVATSNIEPDGLYKNGLQRARFLPAIQLIKQHCSVQNVDGGEDYRLRTLEQAELYHWPDDEPGRIKLHNYYEQLGGGSSHRQSNAEVEILGRQIPVVRVADGVVWFDFKELCAGARSSADYTELSKEFHTLLLSGIFVMQSEHEDVARRFITLVDELYDRQVKLIVTAQAPMHALYKGQKLVFEFERTLSRLQEMQSKEFLGLPHRP